ncbi:leucine-rich repeat- and IQ domain-containing protein 1 isoform X2 [Danio rerio]|uniref:Leucine-rich repeat- and IQ domain-containing protein 1 isoform X2 n=1 Tax=Danio rerio TaxID=7955 RepID=A0AC58HVM3_DANRE
MDDIERAIDEELMKLNLHPSENDIESDDDSNDLNNVSNLLVEGELPDSVLTYIEASRNQISAFEYLILKDVEEKDISSQELFHLNHSNNPATEPASDFIDDPINWKERVISELQFGLQSHVEPQKSEQEITNTSCTEDITEHDISTESKLQFSLEWRELEKRLNKEEEQKLAAHEVERELHLNSEREEEERRRKRLMEFEEELKKIGKFHNDGGKVYHAEDLQVELDKQQTLIQKLEEQMKEERRAFEEAQEEERRRTQKLHCRAATKLQAALRGTLVRRWSKTELSRKREEEKKREQENRELEKLKKEREEEKKRIEEEECIQREETERRRADYERAKEQERHRLEREQNVEQQKREDEMRERIKREEKNNITSVKDDCRRQDVDADKTNKEMQRKEAKQNLQVEDQCKIEEERDGKNKINVLIVQTENKDNMLNAQRTEDNNEIIRTLDKTSEGDINTIEKQDKSQSINALDYTRPQINHYKERIKSHGEETETDSNEKPEQSRKMTKIIAHSHINAHQGLSNDLDIGQDHAKSINSDLMMPASDLNVKSTEMENSCYRNTTESETKNYKVQSQESVSACLPDSTEQKRLAWMMSCTPWSKLSLQNKRKEQSKKRKARKRGPSLPPLSEDAILKAGASNSLKQVTTVMLEDLPGCSLSTLSECNKLQTLTLRRCGLTSLDGLNQCSQIRYIDVQENSITHVDCEGLSSLQILLLGRNQLMNIHGLDEAQNLQTLQLSHNNISLISGLGALKMLLHLSVDHNQLLSTRGLKEIYTLLHLDCSYNYLSHVEGLENCALLNTLDLKGNSLTELPVLQNHVLLRDLYLDDNLIPSLDDLKSYWLPLLQNLSVVQNSITHLSPLLDLVSLKTLDVSHNCLSDLQDLCLNLQECSSLQELSLTVNPLLQENNWRSLILETVPGLIKLNNEQIAAAAVGPWKCPEQKWSFQALCQAQQKQRHSLLQQQKMEISSAPSKHDAQLLAIGHQTDLFRLAVEQRYAHEYGDSCVTEDPALTTVLSSPCVFPKASLSENPEKQHPLTRNWHKNNPQKTPNPQSHLELQSADCIETQSEKEPVQALNLKIAAAVVIQRFWRRKCIMKRREGLPGLIEKTNTKLKLHEVEDTCIERPEIKRAAVVIQAAWRGFFLRKRLARALAAAQIIESDEDFEEVDMDKFIFDEKELEKDWITLHSNALPSRMMPFSEELLLPKSPLLHPVPPKTLPVFPRQPKNAWSDREDASCLEQSVSPSPHLSSRSEESEKILEEWGITNDSTALLILKRANKMKGRKQQQKRLLDPNQRLALFRSHSKQCVSAEAQRQTRPTFKDNYKGHQRANEVHKSPKADEKQTYREKGYQWLDSSDTGRGHFLPDIGPDILNGGRVQLVATGDRDSVDSVSRFLTEPTGVSPTAKTHSRARRFSAENKKIEVPSPTRVSSAPIRNERISFRDNPVRRSGGWGGGKKRAKTEQRKTDGAAHMRQEIQHTLLQMRSISRPMGLTLWGEKRSLIKSLTLNSGE